MPIIPTMRLALLIPILTFLSGIAVANPNGPSLEGSLDAVWVMFEHEGAESGSFQAPFNSLYEAMHAVAEGGTITLETGSTRVTPRIEKPMTLTASGGMVSIGRPPETTITWPVSGGADPIGPLSSTFGSRLKASENFRYDFHRGVDIPTPENSDVHAIADGVVRIAGEHPSYSDLIVQITHEGDDGVTYYTNSIHMNSVSVAEDQVVLRGDVVGQSGLGAGGFPHLHFETRRDGLFQRNCVSPFVYLPYTDDRTAPEISIDLVDTSTPTAPEITVTASIPRVNDSDALDFDSVTVTTWQDDGNTITQLDAHTFALNEWNFAYTPLPPEDANVNLDNEEFNGVIVSPAQFSTASDVYDITVTFTDLVGPANPNELVVTAIAQDLLGHTSEVTF